MREKDEPSYEKRDQPLERTRLLLSKAKDEVTPWVETCTPSVHQRRHLPKEKKSLPSSKKDFRLALWSYATSTTASPSSSMS